MRVADAAQYHRAYSRALCPGAVGWADVGEASEMWSTVAELWTVPVARHCQVVGMGDARRLVGGLQVVP